VLLPTERDPEVEAMLAEKRRHFEEPFDVAGFIKRWHEVMYGRPGTCPAPPCWWIASTHPIACGSTDWSGIVARPSKRRRRDGN
jgi:hypothetical protein